MPEKGLTWDNENVPVLDVRCATCDNDMILFSIEALGKFLKISLHCRKCHTYPDLYVKFQQYGMKEFTASWTYPPLPEERPDEPTK